MEGMELAKRCWSIEGRCDTGQRQGFRRIDGKSIEGCHDVVGRIERLRGIEWGVTWDGGWRRRVVPLLRVRFGRRRPPSSQRARQKAWMKQSIRVTVARENHDNVPMQ